MSIQPTDIKVGYAEAAARFRNDPFGFVLWAFPWGEPGALKDEYPDRWQVAVMEDIRMALEANEKLPEDKRVPIQIAVASGHGIGKTALMAWLLLWFMATNADPQIVVTANTLSQLTTKTWREVAKWHNLFILKDLFEWTATSYYLKTHQKLWSANALPWSKASTESFAGTHAEAVMYQFDEGSGIINEIYDVSEGAMTSGRCIWLVFGNPTRNTGRFRELFGKLRHRWITRNIDSRTARKTNKAKIQQWAEDYGEDSDFMRVRVRGLFPNAATNQLIPEGDFDRCTTFDPVGFEMYPVSVTCDVARYGDDSTVVGVVQGRNMPELRGFQNKSTVETATIVAETYRHWLTKGQRVHCFIDDVGVGGGVTDILKSWGIPVTGVNSGARADKDDKYINKRSEMWCRMAAAIKAGMRLPDEGRLRDDLINIEYSMTASQKIQLESVQSLKDRGLPSPDYATALALAFAYPQTMDIVDRGRVNVQRSTGSTTMQKRKELGYGVRK